MSTEYEFVSVVVFFIFLVSCVIVVLHAAGLWAPKRWKGMPNDPNTIFDNSTRKVKTKSGMTVDVYNDWPDGMADVIEECFNTGKTVSGKLEDGRVIRDGED